MLDRRICWSHLPGSSGLFFSLCYDDPLITFSYALQLLLNHSSSFRSGHGALPYLYLVAPWSPLLPSDHPDYYPSYFTWIPSQVISTQHITVCTFCFWTMVVR
jgi:hypothetical protein